MSHTPGPWRVDVSNLNHPFPGPYYVTSDATQIGVALMDGIVENRADDARLIAAAPDLLEALRDVLKHGGESVDEWIDMRYYRKAELAIAKAEGRS